jgi:multisubunit Na+/H+ antiporter MnhC subunit
MNRQFAVVALSGLVGAAGALVAGAVVSSALFASDPELFQVYKMEQFRDIFEIGKYSPLISVLQSMMIAILYSIFGDSLKIKSPVLKGLAFGALIWLVFHSIMSIQMTIAFNLPRGFVLSALVISFATSMCRCLLIAHVYERYRTGWGSIQSRPKG